MYVNLFLLRGKKRENNKSLREDENEVIMNTREKDEVGRGAQFQAF